MSTVDFDNMVKAIELLTEKIDKCFFAHGTGILNAGEDTNIPIALNRIAKALEISNNKKG